MLEQNTYKNGSNEKLVQYFQNGLIDNNRFYKKFMNSNKGLISNLVFAYYSSIYNNPKYYSITKEDIMSEAGLALMDAAKKYIPKKESKFSTFVVNSVRWAVNNFLSRKVNKNFTSPQKDDNIQDLKTKTINISSLSSKYAEDFSLEDIIVDKNVNIENDFMDVYEKEMMKNYIDTILDDKERYIIKRLFGVECKEVTGESLGRELGISRAAASQKKSKILDK